MHSNWVTSKLHTAIGFDFRNLNDICNIIILFLFFLNYFSRYSAGVPGPVLSEPKVTDRANNRISLTWDRPEKPETVLAYVVEAQSSEEQCWKQVPIIFHVRISKAKNAILNFFVFSTPLTQYITRFAYNEYARTRVGKTSIWHFFLVFFFIIFQVILLIWSAYRLYDSRFQNEIG